MEANYLHSADQLLPKGNSILCFSGKYRLNTRMGSARVKGSMNGVHVTHSSGSEFLVSMPLGCASQIMLLGSSHSTFGTSLTHKLFNWSPCLLRSSLEMTEVKEAFL